MKAVLGVACLILGTLYSSHIGFNSSTVGSPAKVLFGPVADANHLNQEGCDVDMGWLQGAEGSNKCYMLIKGYDFR